MLINPPMKVTQGRRGDRCDDSSCTCVAVEQASLLRSHLLLSFLDGHDTSFRERGLVETVCRLASRQPLLQIAISPPVDHHTSGFSVDFGWVYKKGSSSLPLAGLRFLRSEGADPPPPTACHEPQPKETAELCRFFGRPQALDAAASVQVRGAGPTACWQLLSKLLLLRTVDGDADDAICPGTFQNLSGPVAVDGPFHWSSRADIQMSS